MSDEESLEEILEHKRPKSDIEIFFWKDIKTSTFLIWGVASIFVGMVLDGNISKGPDTISAIGTIISMFFLINAGIFTVIRKEFPRFLLPPIHGLWAIINGWILILVSSFFLVFTFWGLFTPEF